MKLEYTLTTMTKRCPHCKEIISQETHGWLKAFLSWYWFVHFPVTLPYFLIKKFGFRNPIIPKVGEKIELCPHCSLSIYTDNKLEKELNEIEKLNYSFRYWFYVCYSLGAVFGIEVIYILIYSLSLISVAGLIMFLSLCGVATIILVYRKRLDNCNDEEDSMDKDESFFEKINEIEIIYPQIIGKENDMSVTTDLGNNDIQYTSKKGDTDSINGVSGAVTTRGEGLSDFSKEISFCRKCGTQLLNDSEFCHKCGCEKVC